jgi:ABC-type Fe3+/spermidine/putrescine transport system ATPase subunit
MDRLDVIDLHKEFEGKPLLEGVNFHVTAGETLCLLGSSGSGKSTILRIIAGIETPDAGQLLWNGGDLTPIPVFRRRFGLMFQDYALFPHLSVKENVAFGLRMQNLSRTEIAGKVRAALERVNMSAFADRRVTDLSGGEQQRIALARALAPAPRLLMLDEPLAALDRSLRMELQEELREVLSRAEIPAIYVTHDQEEAILLGDRLALLHDGRIAQAGETEEVYRYPANRWVAAFLGMTGLLEGDVHSLAPLTVRTDCGDLHPQLIPGATPPGVGERVMLLLKPVNLEQAGAVNGIDELTGEVTEVVFLGDHYRLKLRLCSGTQLDLVATHRLAVGESLKVRPRPGDLLLLPDEGHPA